MTNQGRASGLAGRAMRAPHIEQPPRQLTAETDLLLRVIDWCGRPDDRDRRAALGRVLQTRRHELKAPLYVQLARGADAALGAAWGDVPAAVRGVGETVDAILADAKADEERRGAEDIARAAQAWQGRADLA